LRNSNPRRLTEGTRFTAEGGGSFTASLLHAHSKDN
jgi:hypothetical protein